MKVFIAGPRKISKLNKFIKQRIDNICDKELEIVIGDANGIDKAIQNYLYEKKYSNVVVYAINGKPRNNIGDWQVYNVIIEKAKKDFKTFSLKDIEMAKVADSGLMIWNGVSKGTLHNSLQLLDRGKKVIMFFIPNKKFYNLYKISDLKELVQQCSEETELIFNNLLMSINNLEKRQFAFDLNNLNNQG